MKIPSVSFSAASRDLTADQPAAQSFARLVFPVVLLLVFIMAARTPLDTDLWWHLRAGEESLTTGHVVLQDTFSFTRYGASWINHSWLSQVGMYLIYHFGGPIAISGAVGLLAVMSMALVYLQMEGHPLLRGFIVILSSVVASMVWSPRPQLTSLVFFGLVGYFLYLYKWRGMDRLWWLIPAFILWSNLHGGYVLGLLLIGAMIAGEVLNHILGYEGSEILTNRKILRLAGVGVLCGLAVLLNPNGLKTWLIPFQTVGVKVLQDFISEWASPDFHQFIQQSLLWLLFLVVISIGSSSRRLDGTDLVMLVGFAYMAFVARRNYGPFAMAAAPVLSRHLCPAIAAWGKRVLPSVRDWLERKGLGGWVNLSNRGFPRTMTRLINGSILGLILLLAVVKWIGVSIPSFVNSYEKTIFPGAGVDWIQAHQPPGQMLNSYTWGGYLMWKMRDYPVFVDGRTDLYNDEILNEWIRLVNAGPGWKEDLYKRNIRLVFLEPDRPLIRELQEDGWNLLYQDEVSVIYGR